MLNDDLKKKLTDIFQRGNPLEADSFFNDLNIGGGLGRFWIKETGKAVAPYERLEQYEGLLKEIYAWNKEIYTFIHKGTPFYFCGIHSFDIEAYDRAVFYFDAGFSEDIKNKPEKDKFGWENAAAYGFYLLNVNYGNEIVKVPVSKIIRLAEPSIKKFNSELKVTFGLNKLVNKFVRKKVKDKEYRSIIPALYLFIAESEQRLFQLRIRSTEGGSIEPFISHLLKGCLIFESLVKLIYPSHFSSELGTILKDPFIKQDLTYCKNSKTKTKDLIDHIAGVRKTLQDIITHLIPYLKDNAYISDRWITITYALRNVTAHNLSWPDKFDVTNYEELYESVLCSIFFLIHKKF